MTLAVLAADPPEADEVIASAADAVSAIEGVPPWLIYLGTIVIGPLVLVLVAYLRKLLKVEDATPSTEPPLPPSRHAAPDPDRPSPANPPTSPGADPQWDMLEGMIGRLQTDHDTLALANRELTQKAAQLEAKVAAQQGTIDELRATIRALLEQRQPLHPDQAPRP